MAKLWMKRIAFALCMGILAGLVAAATGEAGSPRQEGPIRADCQECHESVVAQWEESAHGQAATDPVFRQAWQEQGSPQECLACHTTNFDPESGTWQTDGISCSVCHSSQTGPHPETAMPTDPSSRLCGTCHLDTHEEWQVSAHGEGEMTCVRCHNPHATALKVGSMGDLCTTCHNEMSYYFEHTGHAQEGLLCTDCHMRVADTPMGGGHGQRLHTFTVDLGTCTECHGMEMHFPVMKQDSAAGDLMWSSYAAEDVPNNPDVQASINDAPSQEPAGPLNYLLVVVVGMAFGVALSPWVEGFYRRIAKKD